MERIVPKHKDAHGGVPTRPDDSAWKLRLHGAGHSLEEHIEICARDQKNQRNHDSIAVYFSQMLA